MSEKSIPILWRLEDGIGFISFNTPPGNIMDAAFFSALSSLSNTIAENKKIKALIISGKGRHFSSGADVDHLLLDTAQMGKDETSQNIQPRLQMQENLKSFARFRNMNIPVIAVIHGVCLGAAFELVLNCDFRICSKEALFGLPESTYGLMPGIGGLQHLRLLAGNAKALELTMEGRHFSAAEAADYHIVDAIFPKKELMNRAVTLAKISSKDYRKFKKISYLNTVLQSITNE